MSEYQFPFQAIPDSCPIPPGVVALVGGIMGERPIYALWKDRKEIIIQAPESEDLLEVDPDDPHYLWKVMCKARKTYANYLEIIQALLPSIDFGKTNWAYLFKDHKTRQYVIRQKEKILNIVSCPTWATLIREDEIEFTVWGVCADRRGIWKGKKVDVIYAWNNQELWCLNQGMYGYRAVQGLDVTFEVYGHLIGKNNAVIGLVSEAAWGRMIKPTDAALIHHTISRIQSWGCIYKGCLTNRFMIADGKVRLLELNCITLYQDRVQLELDAEIWHWKELHQLFKEINDLGPYGNHRIPLLRFTSTYRDLDFIPPSPRPDLPLGGMFLYPGFFRIFDVEMWAGYEPVEEDKPNNAVSRRRRAPPRSIKLIANGPSPLVNAQEEMGTMLSISRPVHRQRNRPLAISHHPYYRQPRASGRVKALTFNSDDTVSTV
ncbi:hypothetical protein BDZ97DRAFT_2055200 [Flammula alnicola]|nr:hypothetical protein BDZ97DRAFT_2055200 [Flammula alnicola]